MASHTSHATEKYTTASENGLTPANVIVVGAVLPGLAAIAVVLRLISRRTSRSSFGADDVFILIALLLTIGLGVMLIVGSALGGLARPTPEGTTPKGYLTATSHAVVVTEKIFWAFDLVQCFAFGAVKTSVLLFYRRIFKGRLFDAVSIFMLTIVAIWSFGFFFAILFRCGTQFWALWAPLIDLIEHCYLSTPMFLAFSISDVITDVLILMIPIYWIMKLNMTLGRRLIVAGIFALGFAAVAAGCVRLAIFVKQTKNPYLNADGIGHLTNEIWYSMIEMGISVVAACLPTLRPFFQSIPTERLRSFFTSLSSLGSRGSRGSRDRQVRSNVGSSWLGSTKKTTSDIGTSAETISMERINPDIEVSRDIETGDFPVEFPAHDPHAGIAVAR